MWSKSQSGEKQKALRSFTGSILFLPASLEESSQDILQHCGYGDWRAPRRRVSYVRLDLMAKNSLDLRGIRDSLLSWRLHYHLGPCGELWLTMLSFLLLGSTCTKGILNYLLIILSQLWTDRRRQRQQTQPAAQLLPVRNWCASAFALQVVAYLWR